MSFLGTATCLLVVPIALACVWYSNSPDGTTRALRRPVATSAGRYRQQAARDRPTTPDPEYVCATNDVRRRQRRLWVFCCGKRSTLNIVFTISGENERCAFWIVSALSATHNNWSIRLCLRPRRVVSCISCVIYTVYGVIWKYYNN